MVKLSLTFVSLFISLNIFACPKLTGQFSQCLSTTGEQSNSKNLRIAQSVNRNITSYSFNFNDFDDEEELEEKFIADGKTYVVSEVDEDSGVKAEIKTMTKCLGEKLVITQKFILDNQVVADINRVIEKKDQKVIQAYSGTVGEETLNDSVICE